MYNVDQGTKLAVSFSNNMPTAGGENVQQFSRLLFVLLY